MTIPRPYWFKLTNQGTEGTTQSTKPGDASASFDLAEVSIQALSLEPYTQKVHKITFVFYVNGRMLFILKKLKFRYFIRANITKVPNMRVVPRFKFKSL